MISKRLALLGAVLAASTLLAAGCKKTDKTTRTDKPGDRKTAAGKATSPTCARCAHKMAATVEVEHHGKKAWACDACAKAFKNAKGHDAQHEIFEELTKKG